jgi:hypothetical protein
MGDADASGAGEAVPSPLGLGSAGYVVVGFGSTMVREYVVEISLDTIRGTVVALPVVAMPVVAMPVVAMPVVALPLVEPADVVIALVVVLAGEDALPPLTNSQLGPVGEPSPIVFDPIVCVQYVWPPAPVTTPIAV